MSVEFKVEGFDDLFKRMDEIRDEFGKGKTDRKWREILGKAMTPVLNSAKANAPKKSGQLAEHIYMKVQKPQARDKSGKYYQGEMYMARVTSSPIRDDTFYEMILNKRGRFQTITRNKRPVAMSNEFGNARTPAHPFLRPALESNVNNVLSLLEMQLKNFISEFDRAKARGG
jgi:HK97 gp10 family phage protein